MPLPIRRAPFSMWRAGAEGPGSQASADRDLAVTAILQRLVSEPCVIFAIGRAIARLVTAEAEILSSRVADRPFAGLIGEMKDGHPAILWQINQAQRLRLGNRQGPRLRLAQGWLERRRPAGGQMN